MGQHSTLGSLLLLLGLYGICTGLEQENCKDYKVQYDRVFSVPGDVAMLKSTLLSPDVFNFTAVPYNVTWYDSTDREMSNQSGRVLVRDETLWFLNITLDDTGDYVTVVRTPSWCYIQTTKLIVELAVSGEYGRPRKAHQQLTKGVNDFLSCPLMSYIRTLDSYSISSSITWYRGSDPIVDGKDKYTYIAPNKLKIDGVEVKSADYTCTLTFTLGGVVGSVSETIDVYVSEQYYMLPQVHEPANETIKAQFGSSFTKRCQVFVPCIGSHSTIFAWWDGENFILTTNPSDRIYTTEINKSRADGPIKGVWLERMLIFSELREENFHINYTCIAMNGRGRPQGYFTLLPADPNIIVPIGSVLGSVMVLFIISVTIYYLFKVDIVLWFRRAFPVLYANTDSDGKLYDAYVAYPQPCAAGFSEKVEGFALHALPQVLEKACGYKLFIAGRDCTPGKAIVDSVEENIQASRRLLLLYTASTFISKRHTSSTSNNNNNISMSSDSGDNKETKTSESSSSLDGNEEVYSDTRQQLECVAAMHRALLEGSLKVILVELEQISPAQLALFPESVRHLRKKQGAVCWWKNQSTRQRWRMCTRTREDEEKGGQDTQTPPSPSLSPSSRFWKQMRYHMPVRGKRAVYPEKTALLGL